MHLSMHNWMRAEPIEVTITRLAKFGYSSIEISGEPDLYDTKHVKGLLDDAGLECWGAVTLMLGDRNLVAKDEAQRAASVKYVKDCITMVKELQGQEITIVPATVGKIIPDGSPEEEWKWAVDGMAEIMAHALVEGVRPCIEPLNRFETYFINRGAGTGAGRGHRPRLWGLHGRLPHQHRGSGLAPSHPRCRRPSHRFPRRREQSDAPGMGDYDWAEVVALRQVGYDGALTMEFVAPIDRTPANHYPNVDNNPAGISPEQLKFIQDHGSSTLSEEFYDWMVEQASAHVLPLIQD